MGNGNTDDSDEGEWKMVGTKLRSPGLYDRVEQHKVNGDHSTDSENIRALFRKGLKYDDSPAGIPVPALIVWAGSLLIFSTIEWQLGFNTDWIAVLGFVLMAIGAGYSYYQR